MTAPLSDLTAVIKAFERPACLDRLIRSIRRFYPSLHIIVCDDSFRAQPRTDVEYVRLPADVGLSAGRNAGLKHVQTPYFLLLDDDVEFVDETRIERLLEIVSTTSDICLAAGAKRRPGAKRVFGWHGFQEDLGDTWRQCRGAIERRNGYDVCDIVANFFVAETSVIRNLGWDDSLKLGEHAEFFLRFKKSNLKAAYVPDVVVVEHNARSPEYSKWRNRGRFWHVGMRKHGIRTVVGFSGRRRAVKGHDTQIVLGIGTGGCGLKRLASLLARQSGTNVSHAMQPLLPWEPEAGFSAVEHLECVRAAHRDAAVVGNVAPSYLNYVERLVEACPGIRIVCLRDAESTTISRLQRRFRSGPRPRNHFTSDLRLPETQNSWSPTFPTYGSISIDEGLRRYYADYYAAAGQLARDFPDNIRMFTSRSLTTDSGAREILRWAVGNRRRNAGGLAFRNRRSQADATSETAARLPERQFVFIGGPHRSGTSLLHRILRSHPQISGFAGTRAPQDEGQHLQSIYAPARRFGGPGNFAFAPEARMTEAHQLASDENGLELFSQWKPYWNLSCPTLIEKSPPNIIRMRFLQRLFPQSRFLMLMRHPVAVAYATQRCFGRRGQGICGLIEHTLTCYELMREDSAYVQKLMMVSYEDLVADPESTVRGILHWLGLPPGVDHEPIRSPREPKYFARWSREFEQPGPTPVGRREYVPGMFAERFASLGFETVF